MNKLFLISLLIFSSACASKLDYAARSKFCFKVMEREKIPRCSNMEEFKEWEDSEMFFELGSRSGFYWGCMEGAK